MFNLDPGKLLIIGVMAVILLGPDRLPQVARQVGGAWRAFGDFRTRMEDEVRQSVPELPSSSDMARLARSPSALLNHLSKTKADVYSADHITEMSGIWDAGTSEVSADQIPEQPLMATVPRPASPRLRSQPSSPAVASGDASLN